jgi:hypothetical protein
MPRPPRQPSSGYTPGQAQYILERLIKDRRVSSAELSQYVSEMSQEISDLEARLQRLRDAAGPLAAAAAVGVAAGAAGVAMVRRGRKPGRPPGRRGPGRPPKSASASASAEGGAKRRGRKKSSAITEEQLASRQLQGRYLALVRRFPASKRAQFARTAKERGREAAIKEMQDAVGRK